MGRLRKEEESLGIKKPRTGEKPDVARQWTRYRNQTAVVDGKGERVR